MPAASDPFVGYWGKQIFIGHFSDESIVVTLSTTFVRCVFAAREDYIAAAQHLRNVWEPPNQTQLRVSDMYRSISRFESCITYMYLSQRSLRELRKCQELTARERTVLCDTKQKPSFLRASGELIGKMRNKMQHIEEELAKGKLKGDLPIMIQSTGPEVSLNDPTQPGQSIKTIDRLLVHECEVRFAVLAGWLCEMVDYVNRIHSLMPIGYNSTNGKVFAPAPAGLTQSS